jgi:hypothetical protein
MIISKSTSNDKDVWSVDVVMEPNRRSYVPRSPVNATGFEKFRTTQETDDHRAADTNVVHEPIFSAFV